MAELTKAWDWDKNKEEIWFTPSEELLECWHSKFISV